MFVFLDNRNFCCECQNAAVVLCTYCLLRPGRGVDPNHSWALEICYMKYNTKSWQSFFCGLCSLLLALGMFLTVCSTVQCQENMNKWLWNAVTHYHDCSVVYPDLYCWDQRSRKKTGWKQKLRVVAIMQFLEVPWNGPWAHWEGYCGSAMQHITLNFLGPPQSCENCKQHSQTRSCIYFVLSTQVDIIFMWLEHTRKQSISTQLQPWYVYQYQYFPRLTPHIYWLILSLKERGISWRVNSSCYVPCDKEISAAWQQMSHSLHLSFDW